MYRIKTVVGTMAAATALVAAGVSGALAHGGGPGGKGGGGGGLVAFGSLSSISTGSATVATPNNGNITVTLGSQATYTARSQAAAVAGLKTGVQVAVRGSSVNGTATGSSIDYDSAPFVAAVYRYTGTVDSASSGAMTISTASGTKITVQLNSSTKYGSKGALSSAAPSFAANQQVRISAAQYTDGKLVAQVVTIPTPKATATATGTP